jgi:hypothetical protein
MTQKLSAEQVARIEQIHAFLKTVDHVAKLVTELDSNRAAKATILDGLCESIARDMSHMRQRALSSNVGTIADVAGSMAVMAGRGGGIDMKIRGLKDGVNSLRLQLDMALKHATKPPEPDRPTGKPP